ncbi:hypothetical protein [Yersinia kristensenii]|uniref:InvB/SpaK family type III secretion system chaperone n=1 Tax=Yersinia kristensenii TaxID=28152 RepID=UPI0005DB6025|nr:hypothetical protein [Yersinia kristensenii]CNF34768.1 Invasion protein invB [Yersinia kristensenii]
MYLDIVALIRGALAESGCDESLLGNFDGHSTIALDFDGYPSILISVVDEHIWIWSHLCENVPSVLRHKFADILEYMMQGCRFALTGQLQLNANEGVIELKGMVHPDYLQSSSRFAETLDEFFTHQGELLRILR